MHLLFEIFVVIGSVIATPESIKTVYENICNGDHLNSDDLYSLFEKILRLDKSYNSYEDCDHSVGFHFTVKICTILNQTNVRQGVSKHRISTPSIPDAMTAYFSEEEIILFINVPVNISGFIDTTKIDNLSRNRSPTTFTVIWMQTNPLLFSSHINTISYLSINGQLKSLRTNDFKYMPRNEEQILLKDIKTVSNQQKLNITSESKDESGTPIKSTLQSYLIVCLVSNNKNASNCRPIQIHEYGISCECDVTNQLATFFIFITFWAVVFLLILRPFIHLLLDKGEKEKFDFPVMISCNARNAKFQYVIGVRLAKATPDFDLSDVNIDLEFFTHKNESVAPVFRFKANILEKQLVSEIRIHMWRLTKLPELTKIQFNHSGRPDGRITLFGIYAFCRKGTDDYNIYDVNKNICRDSRMFALNKEEQEGKALEVDNKVADKTLSNFKIKLSFLELIWILFVNISLIAFMAYFIRSKLHIRFGWPMFEMLIEVLVSSSVAIVFNMVFVFIYKWILLRELKEQAKMSSKYEQILCVTVRLYYVISFLGSIGGSVYVGFKHINKKNIETYKWLCVTFCASALFGLVWTINSHISLSKGKLTTQASDETLHTSSSNLEQI